MLPILMLACISNVFQLLCILHMQDVFDMALLSFEDAWKAVSSQTSVTQGSAKHPMSNAQMLSQSFSKAFSMMQEIIHKVR